MVTPTHFLLFFPNPSGSLIPRVKNNNNNNNNRRPFTQHGVTCRLCHLTMYWSDCSNAFNSLHRLDMLSAIYDRLPDLYPYWTSVYSQPSVLFYGSFILMSNKDHNRATLLVRSFSVTLFNCYCLHFKRSWLLDSLTIFRWTVTRTRWPETFSRSSRLVFEWGLALMSTSVKWLQTPLIPSWTHYCNLSSALHSYFGVQILRMLGLNAVPIYPEQWRLSMISSQDSLCLLRASFSTTRVHHLHQFSPSVDNAGLATFDELLRTALCRITNCDLTDIQWLQASLTISEGGTGVI